MKTLLIILTTTCTLFGAPGDLKWAFDAGGPIRSSPALGTNGWIVFATLTGRVFAVDENGNQQWRTGVAARVVSSPAVGSDGRVFIGSNKGLHALNGLTGQEEWFFASNYFGSPEIYSTPSINGGSLYITTVTGALFSLDATTGKTNWHDAVGGFVANYSSPILSRNGVLYVGSTGSFAGPGAFRAIDSQAGENLWTFSSVNWIFSSGAIGEDGTVFVSGSDRVVYALDASTGSKKWTNVLGDSMTSSPVLGPDGTLYVGGNDGRLYALDSKTGVQKWRFLARDTIHSTPAVAADGTVYFGSYDKNVYALDGQTGTNKWSFTTGHFVLSSPLIGPDGTVYIGSFDGKLYAFEGSAPLADSAWPMFKGNVRHTGFAGDSPPARRVRL